MQDEQVVRELDGDRAAAEAAASAAAARVGVPAPARPEVAGAMTKPVTPQAGLGWPDEPEAAEAASPEVGELPEPLDEDSEDFVEAWEASADEPDAEAFEVEESEEEPEGLEVEPELPTTPETLRPSSKQRSPEPATGAPPQTPPAARPWLIFYSCPQKTGVWIMQVLVL